MTDLVEPSAAGCGCCGPDAVAPTPVGIENPPGRSRLTRRVGTAGTFLAAMQRAAGRTPGLTGLRSRTTDDPTVALMDAWAGVLDVLTFYSERVADEGYLATATEGRSVVGLADAVGYARGPGSGAGTLLAFTVQDAPGSPRLVPIPAGTQVASLPGPGEVPQTFETGEALDARPEWNALRARTVGGPATADERGLHLVGARSDLVRGDAVLLVAGADPAHPADWVVRTVGAVVPRPELDLTRVDWADGPTGSLAGVPGIRAYRLRLRTGVFGSSAPDWRVIPAETRRTFQSQPVAGSLRRAVATRPVVTRPDGPDDWPGFTVVPAGLENTVDLDGAHPGVVPGGWLVLQRPATGGATTGALYRVGAVTVGSRSDFAMTGRTTRVRLAGTHDVRATFGTAVRTTVALAQSEPLALAPGPVTDPVHGDLIPLAGTGPQPPEGRHVVVSGPSPWLRVAPGGAGLEVRRPDGSAVPAPPGTGLEVVGAPTRVGDRTVWPVRTTTPAGPVDGTLATLPGDADVVPPPADAPVHVEAAVVGRPPGQGDGPGVLRLRAPLRRPYDRAGLRVAANVAAATHGETRVQVLGSGDGGVPFQRYTLAQAPLTYVGGVSSLRVRVDGVAWEEVPTLHGRRPTDRVYVTRLADDDSVTVLFGDGVTGARLPSGEENVVATYRVGTGLAGHLPAGRLTMLMTYPLGLRSVTNPLPTGLAADPDRPDDVRRHAPTRALTLGRAVSVTDFADQARQHAGIAKAAAALGWVQERPVVHVTVAGERGQAMDGADVAALHDALRSVADPHVGLVVQEARTVRFAATVEVVVGPGRDRPVVLAAVRDRLLGSFGSGARDLAQAVAASEVVAVAQGTPGVRAVTLTELRASVPAGRPVAGGGAGDVPAALPSRAAGAYGPAELLLVDPELLHVVEAG